MNSRMFLYLYFPLGSYSHSAAVLHARRGHERLDAPSAPTRAHAVPGTRIKTAWSLVLSLSFDFKFFFDLCTHNSSFSLQSIRVEAALSLVNMGDSNRNLHWLLCIRLAFVVWKPPPGNQFDLNVSLLYIMVDQFHRPLYISSHSPLLSILYARAHTVG